MLLRKLSVLAAAVAVPFALLVPSSSAASTVFNTQAASIKCQTITGGVSTIKPPVTPASSPPVAISIKGTLAGCAVTGATPSGLQVVSGSVSGTITVVDGAGGCAGILGSHTITGSLTYKWKTASGQKLDFGTTTVSGGNLAGSVFGFGGGSYAQIDLTGQTIQPNSAFAGGTPSTSSVLSEDVGNLVGQCNGPKGLKTVHIGLAVTNA